MSVEASGLSNNERLSIASTNAGSVKGGDVVLTCRKGERVCVEVEFASDYAGPIELSALLLHADDEEAAE